MRTSTIALSGNAFAFRLISHLRNAFRKLNESEMGPNYFSNVAMQFVGAQISTKLHGIQPIVLVISADFITTMPTPFDGRSHPIQ